MMCATTRMIVLGIDPGIARCGWGVINKNGVKLTTLDFGCIQTSKTVQEEKRLFTIYSEILSLCKKYNPSVIAVEKLFFAANAKTALTVGQARGAILVAAGSAHVPISSFTPLEVKLAITGYGKADKIQVQSMVTKTLGLLQVPEPDDTADALAVAMTYCFVKKWGE